MTQREQLEEYLLEMTEPLTEHFSEGKTSVKLGGFAAGYGTRIAGMEGALRVLWGLTPYWAGGGSKAEKWKDIYLDAVRHGADPANQEYWGKVRDKDQKIVEMAALSLNLIWTPEVIWKRLTENEKQNLADWLYQVNQAQVPDSNWNFFSVLPNLALMKLGRKYSREKVEFSIKKYETYYLGNGWYADGRRPQKDYYVSFAIHYYCLLYAWIMKDADPERCRIYKDRALRFAEDFIYWFDSDGRAIPFGRSQTYRFAQAAFWSVFAVVLGGECPQKGRVRGLIMRHMTYWMKQPIFDNGKILTVGYTYPNLGMSEGYNAPGSPYWAFKIFMCLGIPQEDAFWKEEEETFPVLEATKAVRESNMLMQHFGNEAVALTSGQYTIPVYHTHAPAKYAKFAYSSVFGFSVPRSSETIVEAATDSMLAFEVAEKIYVRKACIRAEILEDRILSKWSPVEGIMVETQLIPKGRGHLRKHRVVSKIACTAYDCGFAYPYNEESVISREEAKICDKNGYSFVQSDKGEPFMIHAVPNTNLVFPLTKIPAVKFELKPGSYEWETYIEAAMKAGIATIGEDNYELCAE